jgi:hypothetical protein
VKVTVGVVWLVIVPVLPVSFTVVASVTE